MQVDQRKKQRVSLVTDAVVRSDKTYYSAKTKDLAVGGMALIFAKQPHVRLGQPLVVGFIIPGLNRIVHTETVVVRTTENNQKFEVGLQFRKLQYHMLVQIEQFVRSQLVQQVRSRGKRISDLVNKRKEITENRRWSSILAESKSAHSIQNPELKALIDAALADEEEE